MKIINSNVIKEFKEFALKGNVIDLAVGVVIGAAFSSIVNSLVKDIFTPILGLLMGGVDFSGQVWVLSGNAEIGWGNFVQSAINFLVIALALFFFIKGINFLSRKKEEEDKKEKKKEISEEIKLLREIRDSLQNKKLSVKQKI
jgi:large conductance mechanosensitive channel